MATTTPTLTANPPLQSWVLADAFTLIHQLQPRLKAVGYHLLLGDGVLNFPNLAHKDLDLFLVPLNSEESKPHEALGVLQSALLGQGDAIRDTPDYQAGEPWHWTEMLKFIWRHKRIDVFIQ